MKTMIETSEMMVSDDWKVRFQAEYWQLKNRCDGLQKILDRWCDGTLKYEPSCPISLLASRHYHMKKYLELMHQQAELDGIELEPPQETKLEFIEAKESGNVFRCATCGKRIYSKDGIRPEFCPGCKRRVT